MVKGLMLTERDTALLNDCYQMGALTFRQVQKRHFPANAANTAYNRIQALRHAGYLSSLRVGILLHQGERQEVGVVYRPTSKGINHLSALFPGDTFREKPLQLNTASLHHDLLLVEVIHAFKERFPTYKIVRPPMYCGHPLTTKRTPDAMILDQIGPPFVAIELELTAKSLARYRQIVLHYRLSREFKTVIYVVANEAVADKIRSQITTIKALPGLPRPSTDRFYFVTLSELLKSPRTVSISNGAQETGPIS